MLTWSGCCVPCLCAGTPTKPEPVGVEQMTGSEAASLDASRAAGRGATEHSGRSVGDAVGAKIRQARGAAPPAGDAVAVSRLQVRESTWDRLQLW
jgi:hypothetical protein